MITAVVLAGGRSRRAGRLHKACRRLPDTTNSWLDQQIDALRAAGIARIVLVLGHRPRRVTACLHRRAVLAHNPHPGLGTFASLQCGLRASRGNVLVVPVDAPLPNAYLLRRLLRALDGNEAALPVDANGRGGHPVVLARRFAHGLSQLAPQAPQARLDIQLRSLPALRRHGIRLPGFGPRRNLNTAQAWRTYLARRTTA